MPEKRSWEEQIIDAGFKALAKKHHPDVEGGSEEAMKELGAARDRLRFLLNLRAVYGSKVDREVGIPTYNQSEHHRTVNPQGQVVWNIDPRPIIDCVESFVESLFGGPRPVPSGAGPRRKGRKRK